MNVTKRIVLIVMVFVLTFFGIQVLGSEITDIENNNYSNTITNHEIELIDEIVINKLGISEYDLEILNDLNNDEKYILVYTDNKYLIYDRLVESYIEYSSNSGSPYNSIENNYQKVYDGPAQYYYQLNNKYYSVYDESIVNLDEYINDENIENLSIATLSYEEEIEEVLDESTYIDNAFYFENLKKNMGLNKNGSCTVVSICMLLSYYDTFLNDDIIPEQYDAYVENEFYNESSFSFNSYIQSPGITDQFHLEMIEYKQSNGYGEGYSMSEENYVPLLNSFYQSIGTSFTFSGECKKADVLVNLKNEIDNNRPVLCSLRPGFYNNISESHAVVAYGYNDDDIIVNTGWVANNVISVNDSYVYNCTPINVQATHKHSDNYFYEISDTCNFKCTCGYKTSLDYSTDDLICNGEEINFAKKLSLNDSLFLYLKSQCNHEYLFLMSGDDDYRVKVLNSGVFEIVDATTLEFDHYIYKSKGLYVKIDVINSNSNGEMDISVLPFDEPADIPIFSTCSISYLFHSDHNEDYFCGMTYEVKNAPCLIEFQLINTYSHIPSGLFKIKNSNNQIIERYSYFNNTYLASLNSGENSITVYFEENGVYKIEIDKDLLPEISGYININPKSYLKIENDTVDLLENSSIIINQTLEKERYLSLNFQNVINTNLNITLSKNINDLKNLEYALLRVENINGVENIIVETTNTLTTNNEVTFNNVSQNYNYILCLYNGGGISEFDLEIELIISNRNLKDISMVTDPGGSTPSGTQITMWEKELSENQKTYRGNTLIEGFTRIIYFEYNNVPSLSRLDYEWYCYDENGFNLETPNECEYGIITSFGTLIAKNVNQTKTITVVAVYKNDPSKVFTKDFIIIPQTVEKTFVNEYNITVSNAERFQLELGNNIPYKRYDVFDWEHSDNVYKYGNGIFDTFSDNPNENSAWIIGTYKYNNNIRIIYYITIEDIDE